MLARSFARLAALAALLVPAALLAQGEIIPRPCLPAGACGPVMPAVERVQSDVRAELADRVLRFTITEVFVNRGGRVGEADYLFPLPPGAAFEDLRLSINGELVAGQTLGADEARRVYEEIVRRQRDPALVEWMGHGLLRARIFPIQPGERKTVVVRYQTVAEREGDALRVDYRRGTARPAPRPQPMPLRDDVPDDDGRIGERARSRFVLAYRPGDGLGAPYSPSNALSATDSAGRRWVRVRDDAGDVTLLLPLRRGDEASISMLAHAPDDENGFALVTLSPPARRAAPLPRDVTFVLDVSGSMRGRKIAQAREAGRQLLETLTPRDRFRLIDFSDDVHVWRDGFVHATPANVAAARRYLGELEADGSTNIAGALRAALDRDGTSERDSALRDSPDPGLVKLEYGTRLPLVLFVTDGEPTVGERDPDAIASLAARLRGRARVFTFGLGADVNAALVERLAVEGRGTAQFVRPEESVERAVSLVSRRLAVPVVTDLTVRAEGVSLAKTLPGGPVDVFAGQDLVLLTRYSGSGPARLVFSGRTADGPVRWTQAVRFPSREHRNPFVARLWATQRVGWLSAERRERGASPELDDEIRSLGLRYGIPTELTSYFVREPGMDVANQSGPMRRRDAGGVGQLGTAGSIQRDAASPAPAAARQEAFEAAKAAAAQRQASSLAMADSASVATGAEAGERTQRAGTRLFVLRDGVWTDAGLRDGVRRVRVRPFSDAWFALVQRLPELREPFALGERVVVAGRKVAVELAADGAASLSAAELDAVARDW